MKPLPVVTEIKQTCESCPSQWEGRLEDGRVLYVRYRWGYLSACVGPTLSDAINRKNGGATVYGRQLGDEFHGVMDYAELRVKLFGLLALPERCA